MTGQGLRIRLEIEQTNSGKSIYTGDFIPFPHPQARDIERIKPVEDILEAFLQNVVKEAVESFKDNMATEIQRKFYTKS